MKRCISSVHCDSFMITTTCPLVRSESSSSAVTIPGRTTSFSSCFTMWSPEMAPAAINAGTPAMVVMGNPMDVSLSNTFHSSQLIMPVFLSI